MKTIETHLAEWFSHLERDQFAPTTLQSRRTAIKPFVAFLAQEGITDLRKVDGAVIARYSAWVLKSPSQYAANSVASLYSVVKAFFHYLRRKRVIAEYPCYDLVGPKVTPKGGVYQKAQRWVNRGDPDFEPLRQAFIGHLRQVGFTPATVNGYGYNIRDFFAYLSAEGIGDVRRSGPEIIRGYHQHIVRKYPKGFWSVSVKLRALFSVFSFLVKSGQVAVNPCEGIKVPKVPKRLPRNILRKMVEI